LDVVVWREDDARRRFAGHPERAILDRHVPIEQEELHACRASEGTRTAEWSGHELVGYELDARVVRHERTVGFNAQRRPAAAQIDGHSVTRQLCEPGVDDGK